MDEIAVLKGNQYGDVCLYHWVCMDIQSDINLTGQKGDNACSVKCQSF